MPEALIRDQAAGLRRLLRPARLRVLPVAGAGRAAGVLELAAAASRAGHAVVVLDQSAAGLAGLLGAAPAHDLLDVIEGRCRFADAVVAGPAGVRFIAAERGLALLARQGVDPAELFGAFTRLEQPADLVLLCLNDSANAAALLPAGSGEVLLVTPTDAAALQATYAHAKRLAGAHGLVHYRLLMQSDGSVAATSSWRAAAQNLVDAAWRFLGARIVAAGCVPCGHGGRGALAAPRSAVARGWRQVAAALAEWDCFEIGDEVVVPAGTRVPPRQTGSAAFTKTPAAAGAH